MASVTESTLLGTAHDLLSTLRNLSASLASLRQSLTGPRPVDCGEEQTHPSVSLRDVLTDARIVAETVGREVAELGSSIGVPMIQPGAKSVLGRAYSG